MLKQKIAEIDFTQKGDSDRIFENAPVISSHETNWTDITLEYHRSPGATDTGEYTSPIHTIGIILANTSQSQERWLDGHFQQELVQKGDTVIVPAGVIHRSCWRDLANFIVLSFEQALLERVGRDLVNTDTIQLIPKAPPLQDPLIQAIGLSLKEELESHGMGGSLYVDQLKTTLAVQLLRKYCTRQPKLQEDNDGLPPYLLKQARDYIHAHLNQKLKLEDIADMLGMSQYYFSHLFSRSMGIAPYQYVIQQRVEKAKQLLRQKRDLSIADIALECGFSHQSHLAKYFKQLTGVTPHKYRKRTG